MNRQQTVRLILLFAIFWAVVATSRGHVHHPPCHAHQVSDVQAENETMHRHDESDRSCCQGEHCGDDLDVDPTTSTDFGNEEPVTSCTAVLVSGIEAQTGRECGDYFLLGGNGKNAVTTDTGFYIYFGALDTFGYTGIPILQFNGARQNSHQLPTVEVFAWPAETIPGFSPMDHAPSGFVYVPFPNVDHQEEKIFTFQMRPREIELPDRVVDVSIRTLAPSNDSLEIVDFQLMRNDTPRIRAGSDIARTSHGVIYFSQSIDAPKDKISIWDGDVELKSIWTKGPDGRAHFFTVQGDWHQVDIHVASGVVAKIGTAPAVLRELPDFLERGGNFLWRDETP